MMQSGLRSMHWPAKWEGVDYQSQIVGMETEYSRIVELLTPVISAFDVLSDVPFPALYEELYAAYPDARFLALYRSPYDWLASIRKHVNHRELDPYERVQYWKYLNECPPQIHDLPDERLLEMHIRHHADLLRFFAEKPNFRMFHLTDPKAGKKICAFLGVSPRQLPTIDRVHPRKSKVAPEMPAPLPLS